MKVNDDVETGCIVFFLFACVIIAIIGGLNMRDDIKKLKEENKELKTENTSLKATVTDYKWQLEQVPYLLEVACGEKEE